MGYKRTKVPGVKGVTRHHNNKTGKITVSSSSKPGNVRTTYSSNGQIRHTWVDAAGYRQTRITRSNQSVAINKDKARIRRQQKASGKFLKSLFFGKPKARKQTAQAEPMSFFGAIGALTFWGILLWVLFKFFFTGF